jgi:hypothetical protein
LYASPLINFIASTPGVQTLRFADSTSPAAPTEIPLFVVVGDETLALEPWIYTR